MLRPFRSVLLEAVLISALGVEFALAANYFSPRRLVLSRDYFGRTAGSTSHSEPALTNPLPNRAQPERALANAPATPDAELQQRLAAKGLSLVELGAVEELFRDPRYQQELIVFVDARNDQHYEEGHIPGAYQFDRYYPERYLPSILPVCLNASRVVVYCTGGKCEDSEFAAVTLADAGVPASNISVFAGGITEWIAHKLPVELGARRSGSIK